MTKTAPWHRAASLVAAGVVALLLSGCVVTSSTNLTSPEEAEEVLPASFSMTTYSKADSGDVWVRSDEEPSVFTLKDGGYTAPDGSLTAYFIGIEDPDYYLIATVASDGTMYGAAAVGGNGIMEVRMVLNGDPSTVAADLPGSVGYEDGGIIVQTRADLEAVFRLISNGKLPTEPLVTWVGEGAPPATIVKDGHWYTAGS
jgi:hypothetical protein